MTTPAGFGVPRPGPRCACRTRRPRPSAAAAPAIEPDWKPLGRSLWFDPRAKRLVIQARVVLREGPLEHLLCLKGTKEHEAILATDAQPRQIHAGLLLTGAEPGHPVRFVPKFEPPSGTPIAIELHWKTAGKTSRADARRWVKDEKAGKPLCRGMGLRRQRAVQGRGQQEDDLRRRRRRPDHRRQLRQRDPRPPLRQLRQRRRTRLHGRPTARAPARHRGAHAPRAGERSRREKKVGSFAHFASLPGAADSALPRTGYSILKAHQTPYGWSWASDGGFSRLSHSSADQIKSRAGWPLIRQRSETTTLGNGLKRRRRPAASRAVS